MTVISEPADFIERTRGVRPHTPPRTTKKEESIKPAGPNDPAVPAADEEMFAGILGEITTTAAPTTEASKVGIFVSLLAAAGTFIGPGPHVRVANTRHPLLVWPLMLGRTGAGRKGEATGTAKTFLRIAAPSSFERRLVTGLSSGEGLIERIRDDDENEDSKDKRLLVIEPEFASVMARCRREGSTLAFVQRLAWDGEALMVLNREQLRASGSHVGIIAHITPQEFRLRLSEGDMAGGTYNRYLPVFVERSQFLPLPQGVSPRDVDRLGGELGKRIRSAQDVTDALTLGAGAEHLWVHGDLYRELALSGEDDEESAVQQFTERAAPNCLRIAGLLAVLEGRTVISETDLRAAAALTRYSIASARYVLARAARNPRVDRIMHALNLAGEAGLSRTAIWALFSRNVPKDALDELLLQVMAGGEYERIRIATAGRPAEAYRRIPSSSFVPKIIT